MNITFTIIITAFAVVAILIGVVQVLCKNLKETKEHLKMAEEELEKAHKNVVFLLNHAKELEQIRASEKEIEQKIEVRRRRHHRSCRKRRDPDLHHRFRAGRNMPP